MNKKKIGILTFHFALNYGARLQAYATKSYLSSLGYDVEIINYVPGRMFPMWRSLSIYGKLHKILSLIKGLFNGKDIKLFKFYQFNKKYLDICNHKIFSQTDLINKSKVYNCLIFGSDQIWNTKITKNDTTYFGDFISSENAIGYAISSGDAINTLLYDKNIINYAHKFKILSVREIEAEAYLNSKFGLNVNRVLDPVFLLEREVWSCIANSIKLKVNRPYIFYYAVEKNLQYENEVIELAKKKGLMVVTTDEAVYNKSKFFNILNGIGPIDFLNLILYSNCVYTSSFHGMAFSLIFGKNLYLRTHSKTGSRITSLLKECHVQWNGKELLNINGNICYKALSDKINASKSYLSVCLKNFCY